MANGLNLSVLYGNIGADPELRMTGAGTAVLKFRLATSESYLDRNQRRQERTEWHSVVVWGKRGEALARMLSKGSKVLVQGKLRTNSYEDQQGIKRYKTKVHATEILFGSAGGDHRSRGPSSDVPEDDLPREGQEDDIPF